jgi:hypothetical protein
MENTLKSRRTDWRGTAQINLGTILSALVVLVGVAIAYGSLTSRVSAVEDFRARQIASNEATASALQNILIAVSAQAAVIKDRTDQLYIRQRSDTAMNRAEIRRAETRQQVDASANREETRKNTAAIATKADDKKAKAK